MKIANATSRTSGVGTRIPIVPRVVKSWIDYHYDKEDTMVLDYGAGKSASQARELLKQGYLVTAYEFGDNVDKRFHNELALLQKYHIVYASNVLNVQTNLAMLLRTLGEIKSVLLDDGEFFCNYPNAPRKAGLSVKEIEMVLKSVFRFVERVNTVGNTPFSCSSPVWNCSI
jgi:16S rRNA A1518/A1519 N6-dimethyltransferase RsmA/KsgA/DIM1 with predicted DNA glycosylase/AP lyase activity